MKTRPLIFLTKFTIFFEIVFQASTKADNPEKAGQEVTPIHRIRITLTSRNVRSLEKGKFLCAKYRFLQLCIF